MREIIDKPWVTCFLFVCLFFSLPPPSFFPCGKIVLKKEGTSVQPRSHPCTVWIRAEASANRAWPRYSGPGTTALSTRTQVRLKSKFSKQTQVSRHLPAGEPTHTGRHKSQSMGFFSLSQRHPRLCMSFSPASPGSVGTHGCLGCLSSFACLTARALAPRPLPLLLSRLTLTLKKGAGEGRERAPTSAPQEAEIWRLCPLSGRV